MSMFGKRKRYYPMAEMYRRPPPPANDMNLPAPVPRRKRGFLGSRPKGAAPQASGRFDLSRIAATLGSIAAEDGGQSIRDYDLQRATSHKADMQAHQNMSALDQIFAQSQGQAPAAAAMQAPAPYEPKRRGRDDGNPLNGSYGRANLSFAERLVGGAPAVAAANARERQAEAAHNVMQSQGPDAFTPAIQDWARANPQAFLDAWGEQQMAARANAAAWSAAQSKADSLGLQGHERIAFLTNRTKYGENVAERFGVVTTGVGETTDFGNGRRYHNYDYVGAGENAVEAERNAVTAEGNRLVHDATMAGVNFDHRQLDFDREQAERGLGPNAPSFGLSPEYIQLPDGSYVPVQLSKSGGAQVVPMPDGMPEGARFAGPADVAGQRSFGQAMGKADAERMAGLPKAAQQLASFEDRLELMNGWIDTAITQTNSYNTGPLAQFNPFAEGTDLAATLKSIQANSGFDELQRMRDESPTGGALGQITEREISLLQALKGNIERSQSPEQMIRNLEAYKAQYARSMVAIRAAYQRDLEAGLFNAPSANTPRRPLDYIGGGSGSASDYMGEWSPTLDDEMAQLERELGGAQ